jgi:CheY-like chemotaxis protein
MRKALIVEDDNKFRILLRRLLEKKFRMQVSEAENGLEGIEAYSKETPNLIFLDIFMPYMNGVEYLIKLRQEQEDLITPVVVLTNLTNREAVEKMGKLGITDYVIKADFAIGLSDRIFDILSKINIL